MSTTLLQPYLFFGGRSDEAITFYRTALKAEVVMCMHYKESPEKSPMPLPPGWEEKVMHAEIKIGGASMLLSDGCGEEQKFGGFSLSLVYQDEAEAKRAYEALSAGGEAHMPLTKTFFAKAFGMVQDRFGVNWMVMVPAAA
ncbi:MAG: VOC family protein [Chthoniobacter sp.]|uniref:VOC family protein n=1 Tax=Chthoniobacter sp. TaxID=2510640 RepID=UPI0032A38D46